MTGYQSPPTSWLERRGRRLIELRDRRGLQYLMSWVLLEPAAVKPSTKAKRHRWRRA